MKMEPEQSQTKPGSLFPAYSSLDSEKGSKDEKEWLHNSSFSTAAFEEACFQVSKLQDSASALSSEPVVTEPVAILKRKKVEPKIKSSKYSEIIDKFKVPESESVSRQLLKKTFIEETGLSYERAFLTDKTRDPENLMFEHFERTRIAKYRLMLEIPFGLSIKEISKWPTVPKKKRKSVRYFSKKFLKSLKSRNELNIMKAPLNSVGCDYLPLESSSNNMIGMSKSSSYFDGISVSWKSEGNKTENVPDTPPAISDSSIQHKDKIVFYNKKLTEDPHNVDLWLEFVNFQDEIFMSKINEESSHSETSLIEKKVAILDKALSHNPKNVSLHIAKLKLSQSLCKMSDVLSSWEELIFLNPNNPHVWQEYILSALSNLTIFNTSNIIKLYSKCLKTLSNLNEGIIVSHKPPPDIVPNMIGIFNHLCHILRSCGFNEKAIAAYQALIEFNLFCEPAMKSLPAGDQIMFFEPFWDSGAQRIGEEGAIGWAETVETKKISSDHLVTDSDLNPFEDEILEKKLSLGETWLEFEKLRENHHWLPWKPNPLYDQTNDDIDDPDRSVLFEDVSKFLFRVHEEEYKILLILDFLTFLGFDVHSLGCHNVLSRTTVFNPINIENYENLSKHLSNSLSLKDSLNPFVFDTNLWTKEKYNFINNIFALVPLNFSDKYKSLLVHLWLKFLKYSITEISCTNDISHVKKLAKSTLKKTENRNNLLLWFEYINIEWMIQKSSAKKTFTALLLSSSSAVSENNMKVNELWCFVQSFLDLCFQNVKKGHEMNSKELLWILVHTGNKDKFEPYADQEIKPTMILKAAAGFKSALDQEVNSLSSTKSFLCQCVDPHFYFIISCAKCYAYFQYFSQGIDSALKVYENIASSVALILDDDFGRYIIEQLFVAQADLLNYHTWNSNFSIKPLQMFLFNAVTKFPHNYKLLYLLIKLRSASAVINPTRRFLVQILKMPSAPPLAWVFAAFSEYAICHSLSFQDENQLEPSESISCLGINWRIRSLYEKMLKTDLCSHIPILWRSYLKFEILTKNYDKAKGLFFKATQICGWSKALLMDGIQYFPEDLKQILDLMAEKQLRIHSPLEEVSLLMENVMLD